MIKAKVIADSVWDGKRVTTLQLEYPRFILPELNTHRMLSRNTASSRAIPSAKLIERIREDSVIPTFWGKNQAGMVADDTLPDNVALECQAIWKQTAQFCAKQAERLAELGLHKQTANRLIEPFMWVSTVITATEWDNFFKLRLANDAQPEIRELAIAMNDAINKSEPIERMCHLPYITRAEIIRRLSILHGEHEVIGKEALKLLFASLAPLSQARCARVSYLNHDKTQPNYDKDMAMAIRLTEAGHLSPAEHQAFAADSSTQSFGNFVGWIQYRKILEGNYE